MAQRIGPREKVTEPDAVSDSRSKPIGQTCLPAGTALTRGTVRSVLVMMRTVPPVGATRANSANVAHDPEP